MWGGFVGSGYTTLDDSNDHDNKASGSTKGGRFLEHLSGLKALCQRNDWLESEIPTRTKIAVSFAQSAELTRKAYSSCSHVLVCSSVAGKAKSKMYSPKISLVTVGSEVCAALSR